MTTSSEQIRRVGRILWLSKNDADLVTRCQTDDPTAFNEIVARYKQKVFQYILRMTGSMEEAEDLTQEVFIKTYLAIGSFKREASLTTWIYRIAGNICIDAHRKRSRVETALGGPAFSLDEHFEQPQDHHQSIEPADNSYEPYQLLSTQELDSYIQDALNKLPDRMRTVIILHDIEGMAYDEIASVIDCPLGTVKSRLFNARLQLRSLLKNYMTP
jgi:RNA polymerase sigma-70 factor (ECF subfamily)